MCSNVKLFFGFFKKGWVNNNSTAVFVDNYFIFSANFNLSLGRQSHSKCSALFPSQPPQYRCLAHFEACCSFARIVYLALLRALPFF